MLDEDSKVSNNYPLNLIQCINGMRDCIVLTWVGVPANKSGAIKLYWVDMSAHFCSPLKSELRNRGEGINWIDLTWHEGRGLRNRVLTWRDGYSLFLCSNILVIIYQYPWVVMANKLILFPPPRCDTCYM